MVEDRPSLTAIAVSFARAVVTVDRAAPGAGLDPIAARLLPVPARLAVDAVAMAGSVTSLPARAVRLLSCGVVDHCELRSLAIDAVTRDALHDGATQIVILGAGLDARAWRLPELAKVRTFEVDHPATQRYKRARAGRAGGDLRFVPVDFERDSLDARLGDAGHDRDAPTMWIWEGVTPYLPLEATRATLAVVAARSAAASTLAMTYARPYMSNLPASSRPFVRAAFHALGEPLRGLLTTEALEAMLADVGMQLEDDSGIDDWVLRYRPPHKVLVRLSERLAVARPLPKAA